MQDCSLHSFWLPCTAEMLHQSLHHQKYDTPRGVPLQHTVHAITLPKQTPEIAMTSVRSCITIFVVAASTVTEPKIPIVE